MGGHMSITGLPGQGPVRSGAAIADMAAGLFAALGVTTALLERDVSGEGQQIESSLLEAQMFLLDFQAARWLIDGVVPPQSGNNHPTSIPTGVYPTNNGNINIATTGAATWARLCEALGVDELHDAPQFRSAELRSKNRDALNAKLDAVFRTRTSAEWIDILNRAGVPCGPIYRIDEMFEDPQVRHLQFVQEVRSKALGPLKVMRQPVSLSRTPSRMVAATPERGEHTDEVLKEFGFSEAEISALRRANAL
jgi:formyl-CoA transferase